MKHIYIVLLLAALAFSTGGADISLTVVNDWITTDQVLGIDYYQAGSSDYVLAVCSQNSLIRAYESTTGEPAGVTIPLDAANTYPWGVAWNNNPEAEEFFVNDMIQTNLYCTDDSGMSWTTVTDPAGTGSRGIDFDGIDYWTTGGEGGGLWRFQPGAEQQNITISEIPTPPSGLTVFPYCGELGIAVTSYATHSIFFYLWDGTTISYLGSEECPVAGIATSFGLAYASNGNLFWTYRIGSDEYHLAELSFSILALEQSSWGSMKSSF